ncbi:cold shock domain-containing protein E1-like [Gigantopelta aegis]|uniref:cold shock domain-containing protein E1-like n=1 Tax=Gigantopelta aegis TaxID=1735272 RepID=UPI001B88DA5B|nr:cold shock domain-containing protein E1-like [Gigantopelta aegis]
MSVKKMNSPQWKKFQPPSQDPAILSFHQGSNTNYIQPAGSNNVRETGIIDKLQHSYGFIQCCDRNARLFFHFSEYGGNLDDIKIGDAMEFQMSYDRRTGKPIAVSVIRVDSSMVTSEILSEETFVGSVVQEAKPSTKSKNGYPLNSQDGFGRVTYEHNGECFFLPYSMDDISDTTTKLQPGDQVSFYIATDKRNGNIRARKLRPLQPPPQKRYEGVVCSLKETFGFIERSDIVKEIFFHYSEFKDNINELLLGDDCEFSVQNRNGKEVAVDIKRLAEGTVIFEDISLDRIKGKVLKTLQSNMNKRYSDPLGGRIIYETPKGTVDIPYGDKDQKGDYTLQQGDFVEFSIATDRRDKLQRATKIVLLDETFEKTGEPRETGVVVSLKDGYGFIQCADRDARMFFHFNELLDPEHQTKVQDEFEFLVMQDPATPSRQIAARIKVLPKGAVSFLTIRPEKYIGTIDREPSPHQSKSKTKDGDSGNIIFDFEGAIQSISYTMEHLLDLKNMPRYGDKVEFSIGEQKRNNHRQAVNVRVVLKNITGKCQGFIATLKENYGFIENADHDKEVFFHYSSFEGNIDDLELGDEVEYILARKSSKLSAENIKKLPRGTIIPEEIVREKGVLQGRVVRPMRIVNPDQEEYSGLVEIICDEDENAERYQYGITSLADKRDFLQKGDAVKFHVAVVKATGQLRAVNIAAIRKYVRARVDSIKGQFGFINYEALEGKKLFFHMTEVHDGVNIQPGNEVEFVVVQNQRNGKYSACSVRKITDTQRPERLISRLKSVSDDAGPRLIVKRQPKGPDNTQGFTQPRTLWNPPV